MTDKVTAFTIDCDTWLRADDNSCLLRDNDCMRCCIGIYAEACQVADGMARSTSSPEELDAASKQTLIGSGGEWLFTDEGRLTDSEDCVKLINVNDDKRTDDAIF